MKKFPESPDELWAERSTDMGEELLVSMAKARMQHKQKQQQKTQKKRKKKA